MPDCPRCQQSVDTDAIACPYCRTPLKAHGHPGIPLHYAPQDSYLCDTCVYHDDDTCTYPQRPYAKQCTLYTRPEDALPTPPPEPAQRGILRSVRRWFKG